MMDGLKKKNATSWCGHQSKSSIYLGSFLESESGSPSDLHWPEMFLMSLNNINNNLSLFLLCGID